MTAVSPVDKRFTDFEYTIAKNQPPYLPLPIIRTGHTYTSRWRLTWGERFRVLFFGSVYLQCRKWPLDPMQPVKITAESPLRSE